MVILSWLRILSALAAISVAGTVHGQSVTPEISDSDIRQIPDIVRVCGDENGFPPFTFDRHNNRGVAEGFNIELLNAILHPLGKRADYHLMPWQRCIAMAESGEMDIVLDVQDTTDRQRILLMPHPHYETRAAMLALDRSRDVMQMISNQERMLALDICRLPGWDTSRLIPEPGFRPAGEPHNLASAITMLRQGRCDIVIYTSELFSGGLHTGAIDAADFADISLHPIFWHTEGFPKFFGISRQVSAAPQIHALLDRRIRQMMENGEIAERLANYVPTP